MQRKSIKIIKTAISIEGEGIAIFDTIEYEGKLCIVPEWIDNMPTKGFSRPTRLVCLNLPPQPGSLYGSDYYEPNPIPRCVFEGYAPLELKHQYTVIENPEIFVETPSEPILH